MKKNKKLIIMMASIIMIAVFAVGGVIAWLFTNTNTVTNTFTPAEVPNKVVEAFDGTKKQNVAIKNEGNIDAYVRVAVVVTWAEVRADGEPTKNVYFEKPVLGTDYTMSSLGDKWVLGNDGYYYYTEKVAPKAETGVLFEKIEKKTAKTGYVLSVEIMGQTIQAQPDKVVGEVWSNDKVTVSGNNGTLTVTNK